jgi:hypothetical protein
VVEANSLLHEAFTLKCGIARFNANGRPPSDTVEEPESVEDRAHAKKRQQLSIKGAGLVELADRQDDVCHAIDLDHFRLPSMQLG